MNFETFREHILEKELEALSELHIIAFAASCCERLFPFYETFSKTENWGDPLIPRKALDTIWCITKRESVNIDELNILSQQCCEEGICPSENDDNNSYGDSSLFIEAGNLIYSICTILDAYPKITVYDAVSVSEYIENTLEYYIDDFDASFQKECQEGTLKEQIKILQNHFLVLKEIAKEAEYLQKLKEEKNLTIEFIEWLRTSSQKEGWDFINFI